MQNTTRDTTSRDTPTSPSLNREHRVGAVGCIDFSRAEEIVQNDLVLTDPWSRAIICSRKYSDPIVSILNDSPAVWGPLARWWADNNTKFYPRQLPSPRGTQTHRVAEAALVENPPRQIHWSTDTDISNEGQSFQAIMSKTPPPQCMHQLCKVHPKRPC